MMHPPVQPWAHPVVWREWSSASHPTACSLHCRRTTPIHQPRPQACTKSSALATSVGADAFVGTRARRLYHPPLEMGEGGLRGQVLPECSEVCSTRPAQRGYGGGGPDVLDAHTPVTQRHTQHRTTAQRPGLQWIDCTHRQTRRSEQTYYLKSAHALREMGRERYETCWNHVNVHTWHRDGKGDHNHKVEPQTE